MIVFGTRGSELALTQTRAVADAVTAQTGEEYRLEVISTQGDRDIMRPLPEIGGKGVFTAELEAALRSGAIDAAVHSLKDLPVEEVAGLTIAAVPLRASTDDVLICHPDAIDASHQVVPLCGGARVGTSSLRRAGALRLLRPDLQCSDIRGNVPTRVEKVRSGEYDAVVLAAAGLDRLGLELGELRRVRLPAALCPPAPGQGALGVQCRSDDARVHGLLAQLDDPISAACAGAERALLAALGGGCSMPLGASATPMRGGQFRLHAGLFARGATPGGVFRSAVGGELAPLVAAVASQLAPLVAASVHDEVVLLRPDGEPGALGEYLAVACERLRVVGVTRSERVPVDLDTLAAGADGTLAFTSARAVHAFFEAADARGLELTGGGAFAVGPATGSALHAHGVSADMPVDPAGGARLARHVLDSGLDAAEPITFPCAVDRHGAFEAALRAAGRTVAPLPLYRMRPDPAVDFGAIDDAIVVVTSPATARAFDQAAGRSRPRLVAIGASTAAELRQLGRADHVVARSPDPEAVLAAILEATR